MVPNPQAQQRQLETINSLLSERIQASEPIRLPPGLFEQLPESVSTQHLPPPPPSPPLSAPNVPPAPTLPPHEKLPDFDFSWNKAEVSADAHVINTNFCPKLNSDVPYKTSNETTRFAYTQAQRKLTLGATKAHTIGELGTLLVNQLADGKRKNCKAWVEMDTDILNG